MSQSRVSAPTNDPLAGPSALYSAVASGYDETYTLPSHRRIYDQLAWEHVSAVPLRTGAHVVDAGCGTGRWVSRWLERGHRVSGIERAPGMVEGLASRRFGPGFTLLECAMEDALIAAESADLVVAMGSVQYSADPAAMIRRFASWTRPGGTVCVYVDSLVALVQELIRTGRPDEAQERLHTRRGVFRHAEHEASLALYDRQTLEAHFREAGLVDVRCHGLAVGAATIGRAGCAESMRTDEAATLARERLWSADPALADVGMHILAIGTSAMRQP